MAADDRAGQAASDAKLGAMLAGKGLTPDQVATLMRDHVQPALAEAGRMVDDGANPASLGFEIRGRS